MVGSGAIFAAVTKKELLSQTMLTPVDSFILSFEKFSRPIDQQLQNLFIHNQRLKQARDLLLPRYYSHHIGHSLCLCALDAW